MKWRLSIFALSLLIISDAHSQPPIQFEDITGSTGLSSLSGMMGHAAAWGDFDRDGLVDLFVAGFCDRPAEEYSPAKGPAGASLFRQISPGKFQIVKLNPGFCGRSSSALFVDLDGDQYPELLVSNNARTPKKPNPAQEIKSKIYANQKGTLRESSFDSPALSARNVAALDFNGDGLLDLFWVEDPFKKNSSTHGSVLLKNLGHLKFENANSSAGLPDQVFGLGLAIGDINEDGKPDLFVTYSNRFFLSQPNNKYREVPELNEVFRWAASDDEDWPSGASFGDLNLDGKLDLVVSNHHAPAHLRIFLNRGLRNGIPSFTDITKAAGVAEAVPVKCPHVEIQDFDNDGLPDIFTSAASAEKNASMPLIYRNVGWSKDSIPRFQSLVDFKKPMMYFPAGPTADFNRDGKLDMFLVSWEPSAPSRLLKNTSGVGNWLQVVAPIGTKIQLYSKGKLAGNQQLYPGFGFSSGQAPIAHFGLGKIESVELSAILPNGRNIKKENVLVNRVIDVQK